MASRLWGAKRAPLMRRKVIVQAGRPLVAVYERVVRGQAFPKRCGFCNQIGIVAGLRPCESRFQLTEVTDAVGTAIGFDLIGMNGENFVEREIVDVHSASFL